MTKYILIVLVALALAFVVFQFFRMSALIKTSKALVEKAVPFSFTSENSTRSILILGDSLAVGVGAETPEVSVPGRIHEEYKDADLINISKSGNKIEDVIKMLETVPVEKKFDAVVIIAGANNIIQLKSLAESSENLSRLFTEVKKRSDNMVLMTSGSVGYAPLFPQPIDWFYTERSKKFLKEYKRVADAAGVKVVNLYYPRSEDMFLKNEQKYYAADGLHLTGEGYAVWFERLNVKLKEIFVQ